MRRLVYCPSIRLAICISNQQSYHDIHGDADSFDYPTVTVLSTDISLVSVWICVSLGIRPSLSALSHTSLSAFVYLTSHIGASPCGSTRRYHDSPCECVTDGLRPLFWCIIYMVIILPTIS